MVLTGLAVQTIGKIRLLDRMVWLYEDMHREPGGHPVGKVQQPTRGDSSAS